jgi:methionine sulfoxide reductase heme-binding subunit
MASSPPLASWAPWTDRAGRVSWIKLICFLGVLAPAAWMALEWRMGWLSPKPVTDLLRESGDWAVRLLVLSLAVTPLRWVTRWNKLILVRRMLGLAALFYTLLHVVLWFADLRFAWMRILVEMFLRTFLTVGLAATLVMIVLGVTSNDHYIRKLGAQRWNALHAWAYAAAVLSLVHFFMEIRLDATEASLMTGLFVLLMAFRYVRRKMSPNFITLGATAILCGVSTALIEAFYYSIATRVPIARVLKANLDFSYTVRPSWWVFAAGVVIAVLAAWRNRSAPPRTERAASGLREVTTADA